MKDKIIQIVRNIASASGDSLADVADIYEENYFKKEIDELHTLIQQEREEAVKNTILSIMSKVPTIMPHDKPDYILRSDFDRAIKEVESEGKK